MLPADTYGWLGWPVGVLKNVGAAPKHPTHGEGARVVDANSCETVIRILVLTDSGSLSFINQRVSRGGLTA